jgi:uncharacterized membrane protein
MKTTGILILIPIIFILEIIITIFSLTGYLMIKDEFLTEKLIDKL